ncbi:hypothetical protein FSARC_12540 [Fusarium sarcochroum]|uniref:Galectin domain-containing protein n=1 Tax=Fusarium sarcochroum TaxID=1208366 RepID=A0A8H4T7V9_9HYPO|nr:hypothetical protein FSARC_12540 [Fusarium sarcochroum]
MEHKILASFPYRPLEPGQIRLLQVKPGDLDLISAELSNVDLSLNPLFWALSYVWGPRENPRIIQINDTSFSVTINLYHALHEYRSLLSESRRNVALYLWVDAICINQEDPIEKSVQVPRMSDIYGRCKRVFAWLGPVKHEENDGVRELAVKLKQFELPSHPSTNDLMEDNLIKEFMESAKSDQEAADAVERVRQALRSIGRRPWFRRIWILQEAVLAQRQPIMLCGPYELGYDIFFKTWVMMLDPSLEGQLLYTFMAVNPVRFQAIGLVYKRILHTRRMKDREEVESSDDQQKQCAVEVLELLNETTELEATVPHDRLYALIGLLACDPLPSALLPDYTKSFEKLCHELVTFILEQTQDIRVLNLGTVGNLVNVPSWTPDLRNNWMARVNTIPCPGKCFNLSNDGQVLTMSVIKLGHCVSVYSPAQADPETGIAPPSVFMDFDESIIKVAAAIRRVTRMEVMVEWFRFHLADIYTETRLDNSIVTRVMMAYVCMVHSQPLSSLGSRFGTTEQLEGADGMVRNPTLQRSMVGRSTFVLQDGTAGNLDGSDTIAAVGDAMCIFPGLAVPFLIRSDDSGKCRVIGQVSTWNHLGAALPANLLESYRQSFKGAHQQRETQHEVRMVSLM